ncbi:R3H domain-containing nucleic acid-binding protein [Laspinema olomoucense]|uniref:AAA family ATPase n=1 Tax=Laspinema olomoucense D3b TaxID=2953688 RepID=A0ABT2N9F7_9CYAN|nr:MULTISPECIES: R3H domain-containing nucleic acid-binding protein [unclassified Laspinema]MCT7972227.1 AAA family ATPase [Laspinema sp. D3d]MCT7978360.1 AAA family ATPase [Laspinema sp. D3b]MCT7990522.1 AAA family ATPase [Laspinema sp. D3a]MCT7993057.1 AAA family ATPase [Laspinema sp. D3c]
MVNSQGNQPIDNPIQPQSESGVENVDLGRTQITDDLSQLLEILPETIRQHLKTHSSLSSLIEVVMDLGRLPEARFPNKAEYISDIPVSRSDLKYAIERVGHFSGDNRAGIEQTLHRISAIRNRTGEIIGLTCRVGRSVFGTIHMIRDLVESGQSILMLGRPGVGKTTALREIARVLADELHKRVVIIDTSNEIAGDGDIPHPAIGRARRMQVAAPEFQHKVMIEAVENHMPEVIVIDEIGTELEALAARTIAERGVQLVGTAHGNQIENLIKNPTLCDLVGGIQSVTLGDEEARRRGSQKTVLERKAPPTFEIAVEMSERKRWVVHERVSETVDSLLRGRQPDLQVRTASESGKVTITKELQPQNPTTTTTKTTAAVRPFGSAGLRASGKMQPLPVQTLPELGRRPKAVPEEKSFEQMLNESLYPSDRFASAADYGFEEISPLAGPNGEDLPLHVYPYGVSRHQLDQVIRTLALPVVVTKDIDSADVVLAVRSHVKNHSKLRQMSKNRQVPIFTINSSSVPKIAHSLRRMLHLEEGGTPEVSDVSLFAHSGSDDEIEALEEARLAVEQIVIPKGQPVELLPRGGQVRKMQHELVEHYRLKSCSFGDEPNRRLRIYPA